jgi:spoIIIJ-associated protein
MPTTIESSGKTLDEAIRSGLSVLGVEREAVTVEILSKAKTGIFGIGSTLAKVKLTLATSDKPTATERPAPTPRAPQQKRPQQSKQANTQKSSIPTGTGSGATPPQAVRLAQKTRPERAPKRATIPAAAADHNKANSFITDLLKHFDMGMSVTTEVNNGVIQININGEHVGNLIGRHGETLDAIQHIVSNVVNLTHDNETVRVQVDAADYRSKRQSALEQLARRMAENAKKYNSNMTLEPMNAYERHVIHVTLQDVPGIATFSTGNEPQRRVVISSTSGPRRSSAPGGRPSRDGNRPPRTDYKPQRTGGGAGGQFSNSPSRTARPEVDTSNIPEPPPRTLPVKEFGVKKN